MAVVLRSTEKRMPKFWYLLRTFAALAAGCVGVHVVCTWPCKQRRTSEIDITLLSMHILSIKKLRLPTTRTEITAKEHFI